MAKQTEQVQKLLSATHAKTLEEAVQTVEKVLSVAAQQDHVISHIGSVSIIYSPVGLVGFTVSPEAGLSLDELGLIEQAVLEFQQALAKRRQMLIQQQRRSQAIRPEDLMRGATVTKVTGPEGEPKQE